MCAGLRSLLLVPNFEVLILPLCLLPSPTFPSQLVHVESRGTGYFTDLMKLLPVDTESGSLSTVVRHSYPSTACRIPLLFDIVCIHELAVVGCAGGVLLSPALGVNACLCVDEVSRCRRTLVSMHCASDCTFRRH